MEGLHALMGTLLLEPAPLGGIDDLPGGDVVLADYIELLRSLAPDLHVLTGLSNVESYFSGKAGAPESDMELLASVREMKQLRQSDEILKLGLDDKKTRWMALDHIKNSPSPCLLDEVCRLLREKPDDTMVIHVLATAGGTEHLQQLMDAIPRIINLEDRRAFPLAHVNQFGPEHRNNWEYAAIVATLGRLGTPEAFAHLQRALGDYAMPVRMAACRAVSDLDPGTLDRAVAESLSAAVRLRLFEENADTIEAAIEAARVLNVSLSKKDYNGIKKKLKLPAELAGQLKELVKEP